MRLVTFLHDGELRLGALKEQDGRETVVDLNRADPQLPVDMVQFLRGGDTLRAPADDALRNAPTEATHELGTVTLKATVSNPDKIICIGLNYHDHAVETNMSIPEVPTVFAKYPNTLIGLR